MKKMKDKCLSSSRDRSILDELFVFSFFKPVEMGAISFKCPFNIERDSFLVVGRLDIVDQHADVFSQLERTIFVETNVKKAQIGYEIDFKLFQVDVFLVFFVLLRFEKLFLKVLFEIKH